MLRIWSNKFGFQLKRLIEIRCFKKQNKKWSCFLPNRERERHVSDYEFGVFSMNSSVCVVEWKRRRSGKTTHRKPVCENWIVRTEKQEKGKNSSFELKWTKKNVLNKLYYILECIYINVYILMYIDLRERERDGRYREARIRKAQLDLYTKVS